VEGTHQKRFVAWKMGGPGLASQIAEVLIESMSQDRRSESCHSIRVKYHAFVSVIELEQAVSKLQAEELSRFAEWFEDYMTEQWDRQIEQDVTTGRLDHIIRKVDEAFEAGRCTPL
jgi:hypothetical protein